MHDNLNNGFKWISISTDYFTKTGGNHPHKKCLALEFQKNITTDNATFRYIELVKFYDRYNILLSHLTSYYFHGNGFSKSSNKNLLNITKKAMGD